MKVKLRSSRGQSAVEWTGLVFLVAALMTGLAATGLRAPALGLMHSVSTSLLCAVSLSGSCAGQGSLEESYGAELAGLVRSAAPTLMYGRDMLGLPVDYRTCRSPYCAESGKDGPVSESAAGEPVTLFTRVIDCRGSDAAGLPDQPDCADVKGKVFIQYWAYYPESASLRGAPVLEAKGYHPNDWESMQVRVEADGSVSERASSHAGYNHRRSAVNWGSDLGWGLARDVTEAVGLREKGGWGDPTGRYLIAGGSHAGNVDGDLDPSGYPSWTPASQVRLVPLETVRDGPLSTPAQFDPITPPWRKQVWTEPEAEGTG